MSSPGRGFRRLADVALLRAAVEAYDAELDVERAQFLLASARGRPEVSRDVGRSVELRYRGHTYRLGVWRLSTDRYRVEAGGTRADVAVERLGHAPLHERRGVGSEWRLQCAGASHRVTLVTQGLSYLVEVDGVAHRVSRDAAGTVRASAPALVVSVHVREGDEVETGDRLLVLEAMKMEHGGALLEPELAGAQLAEAVAQLGRLLELEAPSRPRASASRAL